MTDIAQRDHAAIAARPLASPRKDYLFGPLMDFLLLGGGSLIVCTIVVFALPQGLPNRQATMLVTVLMFLINQPHFAHSYQIFYRNFWEKAFGPAYPRALRLRYLNAGIAVPAALSLYLAAVLVKQDARFLGYGINMMGFFVGWHYVKQGYGILIVDSVKKRLFFSENAKTILRINGYACWAATWLKINHSLQAKPYIGLVYYTLPVPVPLYYVSIAIAAATTLTVAGVLFLQWRQKNTLPWIGIVAYLTTLYLWMIFFDINPLVALIIPTFHSLQYTTVVWRYKLNAEPVAPSRNLLIFAATGIALGFLAFIVFPRFYDSFALFGRNSPMGPRPFLIAAYILINVHHYFLDNVMWRRGNPDVQKYLFSPAQPAPR